jgi:hypothetical protein
MQRKAGTIVVEGKGRATEAHAGTTRHYGGAWAFHFQILLLHPWQHETCDP